MTYGFLDPRTTPAVRAAQDANGVGGFWEEMEVDLSQDRLTEGGGLNYRTHSFYMASISESGLAEYPALRRPRGFLRLLDDQALGFTEFAGKRQ